MPLQIIRPVGQSSQVTLRTSELIISSSIRRRLSWHNRAKIRLAYLDNPLIILLSCVSNDEPGFTLHSIGREGDEGNCASKIRISKFTNEILRLRVRMPLYGLEPIFMHSSTAHDYELAICLEPLTWQETSFDIAGIDNIPPKLIGVYQIVSTDGRVQRIGEGNLSARCREHLKNTELARIGRILRFFPLPKTDTELFERVLLEEYRGKFGSLPPFNPIAQ